MKFNLFVIVLLVVSCEHLGKNSKDIDNTSVWQSLQIVIDKKDTIILNKSDDSLHFYGDFNFMKELWHPEGREKELKDFTLPISGNSRDSINFYANNLVENKMLPEKFCTDYVGAIKVTIQYGDAVSKTVTYSSICDWKTLNRDTKEIYLLFQRIAMAK